MELEHNVAVYLAGYMRSMSRCRSANDKTFQPVQGWLEVRYCTWDPIFVKRDERECPFFYTGKLDAQVRSYLVDDVCYHFFWIMTAAEDFAMLRR